MGSRIYLYSVILCDVACFEWMTPLFWLKNEVYEAQSGKGSVQHGLTFCHLINHIQHQHITMHESSIYHGARAEGETFFP